MSTRSHLPSVSVIIPAYNESEYIGRCLESLLAQDLAPLEIIVVDNNSSDGTAKLAATYGVKVINEPEQGIVFARNAGFQAASGQILARCDADSILPKTWIKHIAEAFAADSALAALSGPVNFHDLPKGLEQTKTTLKQLHRLFYFKGSKLILGHEVLFGSNMALTKRVWEQIKTEVCLDESRMHEDTDLAVHIFQAGGKISFDPKFQASVSARLRPGTVQAKSSPSELMAYVGRWTGTRHHPSKKSADDEA